MKKKNKNKKQKKPSILNFFKIEDPKGHDEKDFVLGIISPDIIFKQKI